MRSRISIDAKKTALLVLSARSARAFLSGTELIVEESRPVGNDLFFTMQQPAVASSNPDDLPGFDYAVAFLEPQPAPFGGPFTIPGRIRLAFLAEPQDPTVPLEVLSTIRTPFESCSPPSIAIGAANTIGIAYTEPGTGRGVRVAISLDGGQTWTDTGRRTTTLRCTRGVLGSRALTTLRGVRWCFVSTSPRCAAFTSGRFSLMAFASTSTRSTP